MMGKSDDWGGPVEPNSDAHRVLIVDDDAQIRKLIRALLESLGTEVVAEADNGREAVQAFTDHGPDITFLDIDMPLMNGMDVLDEIMGLSPSAAVVMMTAISNMDVADKCVEAGAQGYIRKGATPGALKLLIETQLEKVESR
jgi:CheY-like chemotaxis protein